MARIKPDSAIQMYMCILQILLFCFFAVGCGREEYVPHDQICDCAHVDDAHALQRFRSKRARSSNGRGVWGNDHLGK